LITSAHRVRTRQEPLTLGENLSHAARFLFSLTGREPAPWQSAAMNTVFILYAEHDFNASTFSARVTASTLSDLYAAITSAIGTLKGPLHGGANEAAMHVLKEVGTGDRADAWVADRLARHEKIMGFGHRVYRTGDSRVPVMRDLLKQLGQRLNQPQWHAAAGALEAAVEKQKGLHANVDLYAAPVLYLLGIPSELNTSIFAAARIAGWCAHVTEQHDHNRLIRPRSLYTGPARRTL
jgi:citrate synthase